MQIPLSNSGRTALVSDEDADLAGYTWSLNGPDSGYAKARVGHRVVFLHRLVASRMLSVDYEDIGVMEVDHASQDPLDCRREKLRVVTSSQNKRNTSARSATGFKSVYPTPAGFYRARIRIGNRPVTIGTFSDAVTAARAVDAYVDRLYQPYAVLNFADGPVWTVEEVEKHRMRGSNRTPKGAAWDRHRDLMVSEMVRTRAHYHLMKLIAQSAEDEVEA